ncbi:MAG: inositol monophosphatase family protein [Pseudanabaena sp. ELA607]
MLTSATSDAPMRHWLDLLPPLHTITQAVAAQLLHDSQQVRQADQKDDGSLVTASDRWADAYLKNALTQAFPDFGVLTEESSQTLPPQDWTWVVDPLDGTTNFARGIPLWAISIGLLYKGTPVFGYLVMPTLGQTCYGWCNPHDPQDRQAMLNDQPLPHLSTINSPTTSPKGLGNFFFSACSRSLAAMGRSEFPIKLRMLGVASYNFLTVALGSTIGAVEATPKIWDIAAVYPILQAVGAHWLPLVQPNPDNTIPSIFPLTVGYDYQSTNFPTLIVSHQELLPIVSPWVKPLVK